MSGANGQVGGYTGAMTDQVRVFNGKVQEFQSQLQSIRAAVSGLETEFYGQGSIAYQTAMAKWDHDAAIITEDLAQLSLQLNNSAQALISTDSSIARGFSGF